MNKIITLILLVFTLNTQAFFQFPSINFNLNDDKYQNFAELLDKYQPDFAREERIINQIEDSVIDGDVEYLKVGNKEIFAIYTQSEEDKSKGGVIILHSRGYHANWDTVIRPLRVGLTTKGWDTLSVQMPVMAKNTKYYDYVPIFPYAQSRIKAAIDFYKDKDVKKIVVIAHACGAFMARYFIDQNGTNDLSAFVGIGMGATDYKQKAINPIILTLFNTNIPILDVVAQYDFPGVLRFAKVRAEAFTAMNNPKNRQIIIPQANHYYTQPSKSELMLTAVAKWLDTI